MKHPARRPWFAASLFAIMVQLQSCGMPNLPLDGTERAEVRLPAPLPVLSLIEPGSVPAYTLRWYDAAGNRRERNGITDSVSLELDAGILTPVLLIPETGGSHPGTLPCAGALYPVQAQRKGGSVVLETGWEGGIAAGLAEEICLSASDGFETGRIIAAHFNWLRFYERLALLADPLALDRARFRDAVLSGKVSMYDITELKKVPVRFTAAAGTIAEEEPFTAAWPAAEGFRWPASGELALTVAEGQTCLYGEEGVIVFQVQKGKQACAFYSPYSLQD